MEKTNWTFIIILTAMLVSVMLLKGCTQFDKSDRLARKWDVELTSNEFECTAVVRVDYEDTAEDDTVSVERPRGS